MVLPTNRTTANTDVEHVNDHNAAHGVINAIESALPAKAADSAVVHKVGNETIDGTKTFTSAPAVPNGSWSTAKTTGLQAALDAKALDSAVVKTSGNQAISGTKTFSSAPVLPADALPVAATSGLQAALDAKAADDSVVHDTGDETIGGTKTFSSAPVVPNGSWTIAKTNTLQAELDAKAADSAVVHDTGAETVAGDKTLTGDTVFEGTTASDSPVNVHVVGDAEFRLRIEASGDVFRGDGTAIAVKVLGAQGAAVADAVPAVGAPTQAEFDALVAQFNSLLARLRAHGLIAT